MQRPSILKWTVAVLVAAGVSAFLVHQFAVGICQELGGTFDYGTGCCTNFTIPDGRIVANERWTAIVTWKAWVVAGIFAVALVQVIFKMLGRFASPPRAPRGEG